HWMFAFHETDRATYHAEGDEIILPTCSHDDLNYLSRRLTEGLDGSQHVAVIQIAVLAQDAFVTGLIDVEPKDLASKPVLHNHTTRWSRGGIRQKIICLDYAWAQASKAEQTEHHGRDQPKNLNGGKMIHFHGRTLFFPIELASKQSFVTIS